MMPTLQPMGPMSAHPGAGLEVPEGIPGVLLTRSGERFALVPLSDLMISDTLGMDPNLGIPGPPAFRGGVGPVQK